MRKKLDNQTQHKKEREWGALSVIRTEGEDYSSPFYFGILFGIVKAQTI